MASGCGETEVLKIVAIVLLTGLTACVHSEDTAHLQTRGVKVATVAKPQAASVVRAPSAVRTASRRAETCKGAACNKRIGMLLGVSY
jgi:hypothetical protein